MLMSAPKYMSHVRYWCTTHTCMLTRSTAYVCAALALVFAYQINTTVCSSLHSCHAHINIYVRLSQTTHTRYAIIQSCEALQASMSIAVWFRSCEISLPIVYPVLACATHVLVDTFFICNTVYVLTCVLWRCCWTKLLALDIYNIFDVSENYPCYSHIIPYVASCVCMCLSRFHMLYFVQLHRGVPNLFYW